MLSLGTPKLFYLSTGSLVYLLYVDGIFIVFIVTALGAFVWHVSGCFLNFFMLLFISFLIVNLLAGVINDSHTLITQSRGCRDLKLDSLSHPRHSR